MAANRALALGKESMTDGNATSRYSKYDVHM
jgi:hypothetical protein